MSSRYFEKEKEELLEILEETLSTKELEELVLSLIAKNSKNTKIGFIGFSNFYRLESGKTQGQYIIQAVLTDRGSSSVTPNGTYHTKREMPISIRILLSKRVSGNSISINLSKTVAGGMSVYESKELSLDSDIVNKITITRYLTSILSEKKEIV